MIIDASQLSHVHQPIHKGISLALDGPLQRPPPHGYSGRRHRPLRLGLGAWVGVPVASWSWQLFCGGVVSQVLIGASLRFPVRVVSWCSG